MSDIFEVILKKMNQFSESFTKSSSEVFSKALNKGEDLTKKGKVKLEIEKLKWDLKQQQYKLGKYTSAKTISDGVCDFSHDESYNDLLENIKHTQLYIKNLEKESKNSNPNAEKIYIESEK